MNKKEKKLKRIMIIWVSLIASAVYFLIYAEYMIFIFLIILSTIAFYVIIKKYSQKNLNKKEDVLKGKW